MNTGINTDNILKCIDMIHLFVLSIYGCMVISIVLSVQVSIMLSILIIWFRQLILSTQRVDDIDIDRILVLQSSIDSTICMHIT